MLVAAICGFERGRHCQLPPDAVSGSSLGYLPGLSSHLDTHPDGRKDSHKAIGGISWLDRGTGMAEEQPGPPVGQAVVH